MGDNEDNNKKKPEKKSTNKETLRALMYFSQIGVTMAASVIVGVLLGKYLDKLLGTSPWFLIFFSLLGGAAAIRAIFNIPKDK